MVERHLAKVEVAGSSPVIRSRKQNADAIASAFLFSVADYGIALTRFEVARVLTGLRNAICLLDIWRIAPNMGSEPRLSP